MHTILVVEDDPAVAEGIRRTIKADGLDARVAKDGMEALAFLDHTIPDLIIADIMMPGMNGYQLYQRIRQNPDWVWIPFIFLTARAENEDIRYGKELGVDDYLTKPIEPEDLQAAIRGRLRRYEQLGIDEQLPAANQPTGVYVVEDLRVDLARRQVFVTDDEISLSPTEFDILQRLIVADGTVVHYEDLLGYDDGEVLGAKDAAGLLRYHIRDLRRKLEDNNQDGELIINVRSVGYRLAAKPHRISD